MRICIDLDGVIAELKDPSVGVEGYSDVAIVRGAKEKISELRKNGHYIILFTARHMKTCSGDVGKVLRRVGRITLEWLDINAIEYDEIHFGKPWAEIYIDDNAFRFSSWDQILGDGGSLPPSREAASK